MSPPWRDEVDIVFGSRATTLARRGGWRRAVVIQKSIATPDGVSSDWSCAMSALSDELVRPDWRNANARVIVSDRWARYALAPWNGELSDEPERLAHGRLVMAQVYGDELSGWTVQLDRAAAGRARLVCALPTGLLQEMQAILSNASLRLVSLQPKLVASYERWRNRIPPAGAWFVSVEDRQFAAVRVDGDAWAEVLSVRVDDWPSDLNRLRAIERIAHGAVEPRVPILVDAPARLRNVEQGIHLGVEWLDSPRVAPRRLSRLGGIGGAH